MEVVAIEKRTFSYVCESLFADENRINTFYETF